MLSEAGMRRILRHGNVFPEFLKYLTAFGEKAFARDEGFAGYDIKEHLNEHQERQSLGNKKRKRPKKQNGLTPVDF